MSELRRAARRRPHRVSRARAGDALELPRLRDERDRRARCPTCATAEAGAPAVLYGMHETGLQPNRPRVKCAAVVGEVMELPPARRPGDLRHARPPRAAVLDALPAGRRPGQLRQRRRVPAAAMRYTEAGSRGSRPRCCATSTPTPSTSTRTTTSLGASPRSSPSRFPNLLVNGSPGSRSGWRRTSRRTRSARRSTRIVAMIDDPNRRRAASAPQGPRLPDRRDHRRPRRDPRGVPLRPGSDHRPRARTSRSCAAARRRSSSPSSSYGVKKGGDAGVIEKIADLVKDKVLTEISDRRRPLRQVGDADLDRAEAGGRPAGRAEQALQAHAAADDVRLQRGRARRRRPADALAARARPALPRLPARGRHAALEVRAAQGGRPGARPRGLPDRARQPRRGDRAHPRGGGHG